MPASHHHVRAERVSFAYPGSALLLEDITFELTLDRERPTRVALIGPNGHGKSTLLQLLTGELKPTSGGFTPRLPSVALLRQRLLDVDEPLEDFVLGGRPGWRTCATELARLEVRLGEVSGTELEQALERYGVLLERFEERGGWALESKLEQVLEGLGLGDAERQRSLQRFSSGERTRAALARLLLSEAELLLLDEPTNHLDIEAITWLEGFLREQRVSLVVVSHDRRFLDAIAEETWYLERSRLERYTGGATSCLEQRDAEQAQQEHAHAVQQREIRRLEQAARERAQWAANREQDKTGDGSVDRGYIGHCAAKLAKRSRAITQRIEREIEHRRADAPWLERRIGFDVACETPPPKRVLSMRAVSVSRGERVLMEGLDREIRGGERLCIMGPNGSGKSTLLEVLARRREPSEGALKVGPRVVCHHMPQEHATLIAEAGDRPALLSVTANPRDHETRTLLGCLGLVGERVMQPLATLSPGELARIALARAVRSGANLLLLDEPTNHLDVSARRALEEALCGYAGTIVCVTHDRAFVEAIAASVWTPTGVADVRGVAGGESARAR